MKFALESRAVERPRDVEGNHSLPRFRAVGKSGARECDQLRRAVGFGFLLSVRTPRFLLGRRVERYTPHCFRKCTQSFEKKEGYRDFEARGLCKVCASY